MLKNAMLGDILGFFGGTVLGDDFIFVVYPIVQLDLSSLTKYDWSLVVNVAMAIATFLAVFVALFGKEIRGRFFKPNLTFLHEKKTQEVDNIEYDEGHKNKQIPKQKWLQLSIINKGNTDAKNVVIFFSGIESNVIDDFKSYVSIPLRTSWINKKAINALPPEIQRKWDLCYIKEYNSKLSFKLSATPNALSDIECKYSNYDNYITRSPAYFIFELVMIAQNQKPERIKMKVTYDGYYKRGLKVEFQ